VDAENRDKQLVMLVTNIEIMKRNKVVIGWLLSLVWLDFIEDPPHALWDTWLDIGQGKTEIIRARPYLPDGKFCIPVRGFLGSNDKLLGKMVKRDTKVMNSISDDGAQNGGHFWHWVKPDDILRLLFVVYLFKCLPTCIDDRTRLSVKIL
jgi:hypothetical protein